MILHNCMLLNKDRKSNCPNCKKKTERKKQKKKKKKICRFNKAKPSVMGIKVSMDVSREHSLFLYTSPLSTQEYVMPAWTTAVRVWSTLYWRCLYDYCMSIACLVLCPRYNCACRVAGWEHMWQVPQSGTAPHPRLRDWMPAPSLSCSPRRCHPLPRGSACGMGRYKRRDIACVWPPSTRNPEDWKFQLVHWQIFRHFCTSIRILSGAAVSTKTQLLAHLTTVGGVGCWGGGFLVVLEMSHSMCCSR